MILAHYLLSTPISFKENVINVLTVEEPRTLRSFLTQLTAQQQGDEGGFVLSDKSGILEFSKYAAVITDAFGMTLNSKNIRSRLEKQAVSYAEGHERELTCALNAVNELGALTAMDFSENVACSFVETADLIKTLGFYIDEEGLELPQKALEYMRIYRSFFGTRLFVFCGLKAYLSQDELSGLYKSICYEKFDVLLIESSYREPVLPIEINRIIDADLCEIDGDH
ncbi:MAG: type II-A CRISPR-associated protein Csn2 [Clostridia bacterium]|nr:type II-A CRISPR-associated protein Csn2 [Clostridia bacterium]